MSIADIIERAAGRISKPGAWTQNTYARDRAGNTVRVGSLAAVCWCAKGALRLEAHDVAEWTAATNFFGDTLSASTGCPVTFFNDAEGRTQAEVVAALSEAARRAREAGRYEHPVSWGVLPMLVKKVPR